MVNLEALAALAASGMVDADKPKDSMNLINKALLVLAEQGVFAFGLFLASRKTAKKNQDDRKQEEKKDERYFARLIDSAVRDLLKNAGLDGAPRIAAPLAQTAKNQVTKQPPKQPQTPAKADAGIGVNDSAYYRALTQQRDGETEAAAIARLILTKQLIEIALTYGRYQSRAAGA